MQIIQAIILGVVQGLTEFIPVSSSGHLILFNDWLGFENAGLAFDLALHLGTLAALLLVLGRDFWDLAAGVWQRRPGDVQLGLLLALATVPAVIAGVVLQSAAETAFRSSTLVAVNLIAVAIAMLVVDRAARLDTTIKRLRPAGALGIGAAQALALVPGVSRSGATITAGLAAGLDRVSATRFSFMLSAPVIAGAIAKVLLGPGSGDALAAPALFAVGIAASFASGYVAIKFLLRYLSTHGLALFAYYRIALGLAVLIIGSAK
ncbi:undecaprenyl-diphosphate phosphatase [Candidatus Parcubacteria bacterium]|nr:undecaprenyl-diphosphate phosphatase [Candidatus Parcubacteria bacterium]